MGTPIDSSLERTGFKVTALVLSKLRRTSIREEFQRLENLSRPQGWLVMGSVLAGLFLFAVIAASFGWIGLAVYFAVVVLVFR